MFLSPVYNGSKTKVITLFKLKLNKADTIHRTKIFRSVFYQNILYQKRKFKWILVFILGFWKI